jgi:hypothetical protein
VVIRGHQRQSHLEGGGVDDRHQLATARIERRAGAHRTARERVDEFGLLILRVGKGSCNQRSSEAIGEFGLIILRVGKGSCNHRSSEAIDEFGLLILRVGKGSCNQRSSEAIGEFGLIILRVGKGSCNQRSSEAIDEFGLLILRVGKGSCNQRSSEAIKSRTSAIRGRHGRSEPIRVSERQSKDSHMQSCGNQRQPEAIGCALRCN